VLDTNHESEPEPQDGDSRRALSRRAFIGTVGSAAFGAGLLAGGLTLTSSDSPSLTDTAYRNTIEPFYSAGPQGGIITPTQSSTYFASFDLATAKRREVRELLRAWSNAGANLAGGSTAEPLSTKALSVERDSMEALDIGPARLTLTFGFGAGLFEKDGEDRYGLRSRRPTALVDLPKFPNDQLIAQKTGGDLTIQACADDPQVAFHAVRQLARLGDGFATMRWAQAGFNETPATVGVPRNLMGFKDGIINPENNQLDKFVWVGSEGPGWMRGGTYLVARRIRISLEHWDSKSLSVQEQVIGRQKVSGAPLGRSAEMDPLDLEAKDSDGNLIIPIDAHVRLSSAQANHGQMILRRGFAYNDGMSDFDERWPPWQQAMLYDAGLLFIAYQRDPRRGFIPIFQNLAENDSLGQFTTQTGSVIVAVPRAAKNPCHFVGEELLA
jgi:deferrochelatase/peroxidase EfeB